MTAGRAGNPRRGFQPIELLVKLVFGTGFAATLYLSNRMDLLVSGSDATSFLIAPAPIAQAVEVVAVALCLLVPFPGRRWRMALVVPALALAALATHRVLIDANHGEVQDLYALVPVQQLSFDPGQEGGFHASAFLTGVELRPPGRTVGMRVASPPLLGLDRSRFAALEN